MDYKYIEQLLERYWKCETSLQEESILRNFFAQHDVPTHLMPYKGLFLCEESIRMVHLPEDFDKRILALTEQKETHAAPAVKVRKASLSYRLQPFFKAAAVVAIVLSLSMAVQMAIEQEQGQTSNVVTLPPAVVPGAPETAKANTAEVIPDSLNGSAIETSIPATGN